MVYSSTWAGVGGLLGALMLQIGLYNAANGPPLCSLPDPLPSGPMLEPLWASFSFRFGGFRKPYVWSSLFTVGRQHPHE